MKLRKLMLLILILPLTIILDLILYAATRSCPSCGTFTQWLQTEGAISFPLVVEVTRWFEQKLISFQSHK